MSLTANSTGKLLGTAAITYGSGSGVSNRELQGSATITYGGASPASLFGQLSLAAQNVAVGAFSLRAVNGTTAKAVEVRNGTTNATQDFYADLSGNLSVLGTGQSLASWLGAATGFVRTWYDQSGAGNHAVQTTTANQPIIQRGSRGPGYMCLYSGAQGLTFGAYNLLNNTNYTTCGVVRRTAVPSGTNYYLCGNGGVDNTDQKFHSGYRSSTQLTLAHFGDDTDLTVPAFLASSTEPTAYNYLMVGTGRSGRLYSYSSGALYSTTRTYTAYLNQAVGSSFSIGLGFQGGGTGFTGEIYEILVFTNSLYDLDNTGGLITQVYNNQASMYESFVGGTGPGGNATLSLPGTSGNVMNLGTFFPSRANPSTSNIFVEAWIYLPTGATGFPFTVSDSSSEDMGLLVNYSSTVQFRVCDTLGNIVNSTNNGALASATWYHVAGSWDKTNNMVYGFVNGVVGTGVGVFSGTARARSSSNMTIGAGNSGTFFPFNGYIRDFRMVQGGIVPTTTFTPVASAPFGLGTPTYVASMGTPVLSLYTQYFTPSWLALPGTQGSYMNLGVPSGPYFAPTFSTFIQCWIYINSTGANAGYIIMSTATAEINYTEDWAIRLLSGGTVQFYIQNASIVTGGVTSSSTLSAGRWYHIAVSYAHNVGANGTLYMFVNGTLQNSSAMSAGGPRFSPTNIITVGSCLTTLGWSPLNSYTQDLQVIRGGSVPITSFTPAAAPFGLTSPSYASTGATVLSLATQYMQQLTATPATAAPLVLTGTARITPGYGAGVTGSEIKGTATITYGGAPTSNTALSLPGASGAYMALGTSHPANFTLATSNFFVECWVYFNTMPTVNTQDYYIVQRGTGVYAAEDMGLRLRPITGTNAIGFYVFGTNGSITEIYTGNVTTGAWYHVAASVTTTGSFYLFLNGVLQNSTTLSPATTPRTSAGCNFFIGTPVVQSDWIATNAYIRDVRVLQGGSVPTTTFTPVAAAPFGLGTPTYVSGMGTPVLSLYSQYFYPSWLSLPGSSGNFMNLGATHPAHFDTRTSNLFMEAWVYSLAANGSANQQIIAVTDNSSTTDWNMFIGTDNIVHFGYWAPSYTQITSGAFSFTTWNHVALSWNPVTRAMYVFLNGVVSGPTTASTTGVYSAARELHIGSETTGSVFNGYIQDVRVIQGGTVPSTSFTPGSAPFGLVSPSYAPGGSVALSLATQYMQKTVTSGTPLFSQLSAAAASSAVGAYSLRALNATTAKVAKVNVKYPTGTFSTYTSVYGVVSASSEYPPGGDNPYAWKAFDGLTASPNYWASGANYTQGIARTTGTVTVAGGTNYYGDWLQIQLPVSFVPSGYALVAQQAIVNTPGTWYVFGSTDGSTWTLIDTRSGIASSTFTNFVYNTYTITGATTSYNYYRIVCNIVSVNTSFALAEFAVLRTSDFWADRLGNLLSAPVTGQPLGDWLQGVTGRVDTWYDQSVNGYHMANTLGNQPAINLTTTPYSVAFSGGTTTWLYNSSVPFNFGAGSFTLRYVVSNNTGGCVLFKAIGTAFTWVTGYEKYFWLGNGATNNGTTVGNYPSQVGNSENYSISNTAISGKSSVVHKATSKTNVPIYINGTVTGLTSSGISMQNDPGNYLILGRGGDTAAYIGNIFELQLFSTPLSDTDRLLLEN